MSGNPDSQRSKDSKAEFTNEGYDVGYGRPPDKYKFKPGQSGNPLGRPKRPKPLSFEPELVDELSQVIAENENGSITNKQSIVKTVVAAARKNAKQGMALMEYCAKVGHHDVDVGAEDDDAFVEKLARGESGGAQGNSTSAVSGHKQEAEHDE
jgi:hypothetical protein